MAAATMLAQSAFQQQQQQAKVPPADMAELTNQIADKLRTAIKAGWISADVMSKRLPEPAMFLLNELLLRVPKLEQAKLELQVGFVKWRRGGGSGIACCSHMDGFQRFWDRSL